MTEEEGNHYEAPARLSFELYCAECGDRLKLRGSPPKDWSGQVGGAPKRSYSFVVVPCEKCILEVIAPTVALKRALARLDEVRLPAAAERRDDRTGRFTFNDGSGDDQD